MRPRLSALRLWAMLVKEFIQLRRDRLSFAMMSVIPIVQLTLFGYAINTDPHHLPTVLVVEESSVFTRSVVAALQNSAYFHVVGTTRSADEASRMLAQGEAQFAVTLPAGFARALQRGERPALLIEADATDPVATGNALGSVSPLAAQALRHDLTGPLAALRPTPPPFDVVVQRRYNPEGISQYHIVPGLMGVILTITLTMMTALALTREVEHGTMEHLLSTPLLPAEILIGKMAPYIVIAYVQVAIILLCARLMFGVPFVGSLAALLVGVLGFVAANLTVGISLSTLARNQTQAMQMTYFFFLPSILLSGFMFPFRGMPGWAQVIGELLPLTHFLRIVRGVMLKGYGMADIGQQLWPLLAFALVMLLLALWRFRRTLD